MNISPLSIASLGRTESASAVQVEAREAPEAPRRRGSDRVEVSDMARLLSKLNEMPEVRRELVDRVRDEIDRGKYMTDEKLELAIDGLVDDLTG